MDKELKEAVAAFRVPPKMVHNDRGETVEVILSYEDYQTFLRIMADIGGAMSSTRRRVPLDEWPRAAQTVNEAGRNLRARLGDELLAKQDIDREIVRLGGYAPGGILPADYCYNLINRAPYAFRYPVFEWVERGRFRYLGPNYPYTGPIFWKGKQVGEWRDGDCHLWEDPRR